MGLSAPDAGRDHEIEVSEAKIADLVIVSRPRIMSAAEGTAHQVPADEVGEGIYTHPSTSEAFNDLLA